MPFPCSYCASKSMCVDLWLLMHPFRLILPYLHLCSFFTYHFLFSVHFLPFSFTFIPFFSTPFHNSPPPPKDISWYHPSRGGYFPTCTHLNNGIHLTLNWCEISILSWTDLFWYLLLNMWSKLNCCFLWSNSNRINSWGRYLYFDQL